jgi:hypothetical protein
MRISAGTSGSGRTCSILLFSLSLAVLATGCGVTTAKVASAPSSPSGTTLTISNVRASGIATSGATISWTTSTVGTAQVEYGTTTSYGSMTTLDPNLVTSHAQSLSGLNASTTYHYRVHSKDANNNNDVTSGDNTFTTPSAGTGGAAGSPVLSFSDLTSGPNTGNSDTTFSTGNGAYVTVWGTGLGTTAGTATVSGVSAPIVHWGNAVPPWSPANLNNGYMNMQVVILQVPSGASGSDGIVLTTASGLVSNTLPFTVRAGRIFYVSGSGNDSNAGTFASPKATVTAGKNLATTPGDIVYVENGSTTGSEGACAGFGLLCMGVSGTVSAPIALVGYPGALVQVGDPGTPNAANQTTGIINNISGISFPTSYLTIAKLKVRSGLGVILFKERTFGNRAVGNDLSCPNLNIDSGCVYINGSDVFVYGNEVHDTGLWCSQIGGPGSCTSGEFSYLEHTFYITAGRSYASAQIEGNRWFEWNYLHDNFANRGFNIFQSNEGGSGVSDIITHHHVGHNVVVNQVSDALQLAGVNDENWVYDNLFINVGLPSNPAGDINNDNTSHNCMRIGGGGPSGGPTPNPHVYNNTCYTPACGTINGSVCGGGGNSVSGAITFPSTGVNYDIHNNIFYLTNNTLPYATNPAGTFPSGAAQSSNNLWFGGAGAAPSFDSASLNVDPKFVSNPTVNTLCCNGGPKDGNVRLQSNSPAIGNGTNLGSSFVTSDLDGTPQPTNGVFDLGAYQVP